jgi:polar amino acid transport system substrate-binding protein
VEELNLLGRSGTLRVGINVGNSALARDDGGTLTGPAPDLARVLAREAGLALEFVVFTAALDLAKAAAEDRWDVGFLANDPARSHLVACSRPYLTIEATFAHRPEGAATTPSEADRPGLSIISVTGAAFDGPLRAMMKHAAVLPSASGPDAVKRFLAGEADLVAGVRQTLERRIGDDPGAIIMADSFGMVEQTIAVPSARASQVALLNRFLEGRGATG